MCCLYGILDYNNVLSKREKTKLVRSLAKEAEERGTDSAGIAFNVSGKIQIEKKPLPGHKCRFSPSGKAPVIMGHTRYATQGSPKHNYNNHPFYGNSAKPFAFAHNGVLYNDYTIRKTYKLPNTKIETDSYIVVQLIEKYGGVSFDTLKKVSEIVSGTFVFTVLDSKNRLYFVKGDNPLTIYQLENGIYVYASTKAILEKALMKAGFNMKKHKTIDIVDGDILRISNKGIEYDYFKFDSYYYTPYGYGYNNIITPIETQKADNDFMTEYMELLYTEGERKGYTRSYIDFLIDSGYSLSDIEDRIYIGEKGW